MESYSFHPHSQYLMQRSSNCHDSGLFEVVPSTIQYQQAAFFADKQLAASIEVRELLL